MALVRPPKKPGNGVIEVERGGLLPVHMARNDRDDAGEEGQRPAITATGMASRVIQGRPHRQTAVQSSTSTAPMIATGTPGRKGLR